MNRLPSSFAIRATAIAFCGLFWLAFVSCANHYSHADADAQEAFVSYRGCASCASFAALPDNALTLTDGRLGD